MNRELMEEGIRTFLRGVLQDNVQVPAPEMAALLRDTPRRVATAFSSDILAGYEEDPAAHLEPIPLPQASGPVALQGIRFTSVCAHHLLPYRGEAHIGFIPDRAHVGLGGIARLVDSLARRLTLQESLTAAIADRLFEALKPFSLVVLLEAEHMCLSVRGARKTGHRFRCIERRGDHSPELERLCHPGREL